MRLRKAAFASFLTTDTLEYYIAYRRQVAVTRKGLQCLKRDSFRRFYSRLRKDTNPTYVWRMIKRFDSRWNRTETDSAYDDDKVATVSSLIDSLCPPWAPVSFPNLTPSGENPFLDLPFSLNEREFALASVNSYSSPGIDNIDYCVLQHFSLFSKASLLHLYNLLFCRMIFLQEWSKYLVFFIPKQDKIKFQSISLSSCLCKTMERMLVHRLNWWLETGSRYPLHSSVSGSNVY